ncbi:MAG: ABC transporter ATP-binding protein [Chloroflexi bacterium]|nr:ABC transporter ATP-binding protein [Chloroflexota bacterium]
MSEAIALDHVSVGYGRGPVLADVSFAVQDGEFVAVAGRSGTGKTTLLRAIAGLIQPEAGSVRVLGGAPAEARRAKRIGLVAQDALLHPWLTVLANVELPLQVNEDGDSGGALPPREWVERVGLTSAISRYPHELSGGMRQRVALARALVTGPDLLLMDEPLAALDELTREELRGEIVALWSASRCAVVYVTHDLDEAVLLADRVLVLGGHPGHVTGEVAVDVARPRPLRLTREPQLVLAAESVRQLLP